MRFFVSYAAIFTFLTGAHFAFAEANSLNCLGRGEDDLPVEVIISIDDEGFARARIKHGELNSISDHLSSRLSYQAEGPSILHWQSPIQKDVVTVSHTEKENFKITLQTPETPIGSMKTKLVKLATSLAFCEIKGTWAAQLEEVIPESVNYILKTLNQMHADQAITMVRDSDYSKQDKETVFAAILNLDLAPHARQLLTQAIFTSDLSVAFQLQAIEKTKSHDTTLLTTALQALATCDNCQLHESVYRQLTLRVRSQISSKTPEALEAWKAFANLTFRKSADSMSNRKEALALIFSAKTLAISSADQQLGELASLLIVEIPTGQLAADHNILLNRIVDHPRFSKQASIFLTAGLLINHAGLAIGKEILDPSLQLELLKKIKIKSGGLSPFGQDHMNWLIGESLLAKSSPSDIAKIVADNANDELVLESVLDWMADQSEPIPQAHEIIAQILKGAGQHNPDHLEFKFSSQQRGLLTDLATFAFSPQAQATQTGSAILISLLTKQPLSNSLLQKIGASLYGSSVFNQKESEHLMALVVNHPQYLEIRTTEMPDGLISTYLNRALTREQTFKPGDAPLKFSVMFLRSLLKRIVDTRHLDLSDHDGFSGRNESLEKKANELIIRAAPL